MSRLATRGEKAPPPAPANSRQRTVLIAVLVLIVLVSAGASYAWSRTISSAAGPTTGPNSHVHTLIVQRNGTLLLGDQQGLWRSRTGKTWRGYGPPLSHLMPLCVVRLGRTILSCSTGLVTGHAFAGTPKGLWRSANAGRTWRRTSLPDLDVIALASNPGLAKTVVAFARPDSPTGTGHGGVWASTNAGLTWRRINRHLAQQAPNGLALLPGRPFTVLFASATTLSIWRSADGGAHWANVRLGASQPLSLAISPIDDRLAYAGGTNGIWRSADAGLHWRLRWPGPPTPLLAPAYDHLDHLYAYGSSAAPSVYSVSQSRGMVKGSMPNQSGQPYLIVSDPTSGSRLYAAYSFPLRIYGSNDGGKTWTKIL